MSRVLDWLLRRDRRPTPEERAEPAELEEARVEHRTTLAKATKVLSERKQLDSYRRLSHGRQHR